MLLPWRVNGTLDPGEEALFEAHLAECAECRADLAANLALRERFADMPLEFEPVRSRALDRLLAEPKPGFAPPWEFLRRRITLGWALAGQGALAAAAVALFVVLQPGAPREDYSLLGSEPAAVHGNAIVLFAPDATEREMRAALAAVEGRIVDGPTAAGAWTVRVDDGSRSEALGRLRQLPQVVLAEPIDAGDAR